MQREYLSHALTVPMKYVSGAIAAFAILAAMLGLIEIKIEVALLLIFIAAFSAFSWLQYVVYIEGPELVVERNWQRARFSPEDVSDVTYFGPTKLLKLSFNKNTKFGRSIIFGPRPNSIFRRGGPMEDQGPVFARIGEFCGWKTS